MSELSVCFSALIVGFAVSALIVLWANSLLTPEERSRRSRAVQEVEVAWRQLIAVFRRRRWRRLPPACWLLWRTYARWKKLSWIGYLDLSLVRFLFLVTLAVVSVDFWDVAMALVEWLREDA